MLCERTNYIVKNKMLMSTPLVAGNDMGFRGCIASAGFTWCEILGRCVREWVTACEYPKDCLTWYDGCNTCQLINGELGLCTDAFCYTTEIFLPYCMVQAPEAVVPHAGAM